MSRRSSKVINDKAKGLHVTVERGYAASTDWYQKILDNTDWYRVKYKSNRFGKDCETPCWTTFFGGVPDYEPYERVPAWLQPLVDQVSTDLGVPFNAFLLRLYFDGEDEIAWHTDGRTFLGPTPVIASLSFGAAATFQMRRMTNVWPAAGNDGIDRSTPQRDFVVNDGDMLVMRHVTQQHWHHRVPKQKGRKPRLNINFRRIIPGPEAERGQKTYYKYMVHGDEQTPRTLTFAQIMSKRGGLMNFFRPVGVNKGAKENVAGATKSLIQTTPITGESSSLDRDCSPDEKGEYLDSDCVAYLEAEKAVDKDVFLSLPMGMRKEIICDWKTRHQSKRPASKPIIQSNKKRSKNNENTLDKFFRVK